MEKPEELVMDCLVRAEAEARKAAAATSLSQATWHTASAMYLRGKARDIARQERIADLQKKASKR